MTENLAIISLIGFVLGIILSVPAGGPTSIVIFTNALMGKTRNAHQVNAGAAAADLVYAFISFFGLNFLYSLYQPLIPYILLIGSGVVFYTGFKIIKTKTFNETLASRNINKTAANTETSNKLLTGIILGFVNPGLFFSWMTTSFILLSMLSSIGFYTGGLEQSASHMDASFLNNNQLLLDSLNQSLNEYNISNYRELISDNDPKKFPASYPLLLSSFYAFFVAAGSVLWFYCLTLIVTKFRDRFNLKAVHRFIQIMGLLLCYLSLVLLYKGITEFL